jgi:plasmid stabilization system protein ParE
VEYKILFSEAALINLEALLEFIERDSPSAAEHFGNALLDHIDLLASFPRMGELVPRRPRIRKLLHTPIRIYYRIHENGSIVEILEFRHGARKPAKP